MLKQGLPSDETICFKEGAHPTDNIQPAYGWIKKGMPNGLPKILVTLQSPLLNYDEPFFER